MEMRNLVATGCIGLALAVCPARADQRPDSTESSRRFLASLTVTATRTERAVDEVPGTVTVIGREQIENQVMSGVRDLVRYEPGVYVEGSASPAGLGGFNIRGIGGNRVQTRVDGVPVAEQFEFGHFDVPPFSVSLESVESVEILRGAASSLYGSDALGGVVSLVTRDPKDYLGADRRAYWGLQAGVDGRDRSNSTALTWAGSGPRWQSSLSINRRSGRERDNMGRRDSVGATRTAPDPQTRRALGWLAKSVHTASPSTETKFTLEGLERQAETRVLSALGTTNLGAIFGFGPEITYLVDKPAVDSDDEQTRWRFGVEQSLTGRRLELLLWRLYVQSSRTEQYTREIRVTTRGGGPFGPLSTSEALRDGLMRFEQDSIGGEIQAERAIGGGRIIWGTTLSLDRFDQVRDRPETDRSTGALLPSSDGLVFPTKYFPESRVLEAGLYAQAEFSFQGGRLQLTPGLRYDRFDLGIDRRDPVFLSGNQGTPPPVELSQGAISPKLGLVVAVSERLTLHAQYAHGFRAPPYSAVNSGFTHLAGGQTRLPNPGLASESSDGFEFGVRATGRFTSFSLTAFSNDYRDFIELVVLGLNPATGLTEFQQQNVTRVRISGIEAAAQLELGPQWTLRAAGAWIEGEDRSRSVPLNSLQPPQIAFGLARESRDRKLRVEIAGRLVQAKGKGDLDLERFDQFATASYRTVDAFAAWTLSRSMQLTAGVTNVFDETYWPWANALGRRESSTTLLRHTEAGRAVSISLRIKR